MSAMVRFGRRTAILRAGRWISAEVDFEVALNSYTSEWFQNGSAPAPGRDQELAVAHEVARHFGGRVALHLKTRRKLADRYFLRQRQLGFDF